MAPILTYATILWQAIVSPGIAAVPLKTLLTWFNAARRKETPRSWGEVCGPYSAMALSLKRIKWKMSSLAVFQDHKGEEHNIGAIGPRMFASLLKGAWKHRQAEKAAEQLRARQLEHRACRNSWNKGEPQRGAGLNLHPCLCTPRSLPCEELAPQQMQRR